MHLKIAEFLVSISPDYPFEKWPERSFTSFRGRHADISVSFIGRDHIDECDIKPIINEAKVKWTRGERQDAAYSVYIYDDESPGEIRYKLDVSEKWDQACIYFLNGLRDNIHPFKGYIGSLIFRNSLLFRDGITIHASAVEYKRRGILFTAPAGTGKSTQAGLWVRMKNARILNDDTPSIRFIDEKPFVFGTPWAGKSDLYLNRKAELNTIVILEQAETNTIRRLTGSEAVALLTPRFFLPYYDENMMSRAFDVINRIIERVQVYHFRCRPDVEAVEMVNSILGFRI